MKGVFKYSNGIIDFGIFHQGRPQVNRVFDIHGFVNAYCVRDIDPRRSTSVYIFNVFRRTISWMSKR